ncbi:MAG: alpha/beta hydrolase [Planctomyces sp.]|nr:alpha/beta hydrolase [Planctomyces sp.]
MIQRSAVRRPLAGILLLSGLIAATGQPTFAQPPVKDRIIPARTWTLKTRDSLGALDDENAGAQEALDGLRWKPSDFRVSSSPLQREQDEADALIRFPSPVPCGIEQCDSASLHWYAARGDDGEVLEAPAVVIVHESGSRQTIGRLFARAFRDKGVHAFLLSLPNYGPRRSPDSPATPDALLVRMKQGIADARRARDVVAEIPAVDSQHIGLQGISLGGFVATTAGSLDGAYHAVFIMLSGGDLAGIIRDGGDVAAQVRQRLAQAGIDGDAIEKLAWPVEPLRVAHRLNPERTWMYTATRDQIIPRDSAMRLAEAAGLAESHHVMLAADHYTGVIYYPIILNQMIEQLRK